PLLLRPATPEPPAQQAPATVPVALPPGPPPLVYIEVSGGPAGLRARLDGSEVETPIALRRGPERHELVFEAPGYQPLAYELDGERSRTLDLRRMRPEPRPPAPAPAGQ